MRALIRTGAVLAALGLSLTAPASAQAFGGADVKPAFRPGDDQLTCQQLGMEMQQLVQSPEYAASMGKMKQATGDMQATIEREQAIQAAQAASDNALLALESSPNPVVRMAAAEEQKRRNTARAGGAEARSKDAVEKMDAAVGDLGASGKSVMPRAMALYELAQRKKCPMN